MKKLRITLLKSVFGVDRKLRKTIESLGLGKVNSSVVHDASPSVLGKLNKVANLLKVEEVK